jgi:hypothetical protein
MTEELSMFEVTDEQQKARLEAIQAVQGEMGWRWFIAEIQSEIDTIDAQLQVVSDLTSLGRLQGRRDAFEQILAFEDTVDALLNPQEEG